jgi:hypothetical protein
MIGRERVGAIVLATLETLKITPGAADAANEYANTIASDLDAGQEARERLERVRLLASDEDLRDVVALLKRYDFDGAAISLAAVLDAIEGSGT